MRYYLILKPLYNERKRRELQPGEIMDFTPEDGAILAGRGFVLEVGEREVMRRKGRFQRRTDDPELEKLDFMEV